jgi:hypothetical protein
VIWNTEQPPGLVIIAFTLGILSLALAIVALANTGSANPPPPDTTENDLGWMIVTWSLTLLAIPLAVIMTARRQAIVIPRTQKDAPPFLERNRDQIAINAIFTVFGGVLGIVGTLLIQSLVDTK